MHHSMTNRDGADDLIKRLAKHIGLAKYHFMVLQSNFLLFINKGVLSKLWVTLIYIYFFLMFASNEDAWIILSLIQSVFAPISIQIYIFWQMNFKRQLPYYSHALLAFGFNSTTNSTQFNLHELCNFELKFEFFLDCFDLLVDL